MDNQYCTSAEKSSILVLPIEMIGKILSYLTTEKAFFWSYGLVCNSFLSEVAKIMKEKHMEIKLNRDKLFEKQVEWICKDDCVASVIEEIGLDLSNNKLIDQQNITAIFNSCTRIKSLDLSFCDLKEEDVLCLSILSRLKRLNLSGCSTLNDDNLSIIVKHCTELNSLTLLMCENVSDLGE
jgi:hypothetical protein